ncbi:sensor histidine kinase [Pedobacter faecalis]|uniref:sensor histidine kinase n=1 Tax=Pedobacter faecalis TaxID=3041495 RepID=UPI00254D77AF|nr:7TM diverse intracellular signaling domain-containing protein [Pedobacter sp. ELA7]
MKRFTFLIGMLIMTVWSVCNAHDNIADSNVQRTTDLGERAWLLPPREGNDRIEDIRKSDWFYRSDSKVINFGISKNAGWVKLHMTSPKQDNAVLLIEQSRLMTPECYVVTNDNLIRRVPVTAIKDVPNRQWPGTGFIANLPNIPGTDSYEVFIKLMSNELLVTTLKVGTKESLSGDLISKEMLFGLYSGIMFVMLIYNSFLYISVRDRSYIYYVLYILSIWLTQISISGFASKYLWLNNDWLAANSVSVFSSLSGITAFIFIKEFLNIGKYEKLLSRLIYFNLSTFSLSLCFTLFGARHLDFITMQLATFVGSLIALYIGFIVYKQGFAPAKYFLIAWSLLLVGACLFIMKDYNIIPYNNVTIYILQIASATEVTLLSFALADKINIFKREKEESQARALEVVTENEKLVREQNVLLEIKVKERTEALETANDTLNATLTDLKEAQSQLVDQEKMAGLGQLTAGIAHEINNPINFVTSNIKPLELDINDLNDVIQMYEKLDPEKDLQSQISAIESFKKRIDLNFVREEIKSLLSGIGEGAKRTAEIIRSLKNFSRLDENDTKPVNIAEGLDSTLVLIRSTFPGNLKIIKDYQPVPEVECMPGKINQVFMNLMSNAVHAIKSKPVQNEEEFISLKTWQEGDHVKISIKDSGTGMPDSVKQKIFEPFFTTKDVGEGTGLGLSIVFRIIENHRGTIDVVTKVNEGTEFIINLPIKH